MVNLLSQKFNMYKSMLEAEGIVYPLTFLIGQSRLLIVEKTALDLE
jgi:hypothetical protein